MKLDKSIIALLFQLYLELIEGILVVEVESHVSLEDNSEVFAHMDGLSNEEFQNFVLKWNFKPLNAFYG